MIIMTYGGERRLNQSGPLVFPKVHTVKFALLLMTSSLLESLLPGFVCRKFLTGTPRVNFNQVLNVTRADG